MQTIETEHTDRPIFQPSAETEAIIKMLRETPVGGVLTWLQMQQVCQDMRKLRACLQTARKHLLDESQAVFAAVRGVGLKRLQADEVVEQEGTTHIRIRRAVKKSLRRLSTVEPEQLEPQRRQQHTMTAACLGAIALCVKPASVDKLKQITMGNGAVDGKGALLLFGR